MHTQEKIFTMHTLLLNISVYFLWHCPYTGFLCFMDFFVKLPVHHQPALVFFAVIFYLVDAGEDSL